jgi:rhodanese-related sulfurtransferase
MMYVRTKNIIPPIVVVLSMALFDPTHAVELKEPYCGTFAVYTTLKLFNKDIEFKELMKEEYIGSREGSSIYELSKALEDHQMQTMRIEKYTTNLLRLSPYPVILYVRKAHNSKYNHYMVYLGREVNKAILFDNTGVQLMPFYKLKSIWSGNGVIVSDRVIEDSVFKLSALKTVLLRITCILIPVLLIKYVLKKKRKGDIVISRAIPNRIAMAQCIVISFLAALAAVLYNFVNDGGYFAHNDATASIQQAHVANFIPKVSERKVHKLLNDDTIFIDARLARDYKAGHIRGAISVPVDANDLERQKVTADIPKDSRIVMYCQSSRCKYAEIVAIKLKDDGFSDISIFKGGWVEWKVKNGKKEETS